MAKVATKSRKLKGSSRISGESPAREDLALVVELDDFDSEVRAEIIAAKEKDRVLGGAENGLRQRILDAFPKIVADRVKAIVPDDMIISEIGIKLRVEIKVPGFAGGGDLDIRLKPRT
jgi:hypothetical protein